MRFLRILGLTLRCPSCSGRTCDEVDIPEIECTIRVPSMVSSNKRIYEESDYGCLDMEYETEGKLNYPIPFIRF